MPKQPKFLTRIIQNWFFNANSDKAAAITFHTLFSFPPLLFLCLNFATLIFHKEHVEKLMLEWMENFTGPEIIIAIQDIFNNSANFNLANSIISFLLLFYASAKIFTELNTALNRIYRVKTETQKSKIKSFLEQQALSFIFVTLTCLLIFITLIINFTLNKISLQFHDDFPNIGLLHTINNLASTMILGAILLITYKFLPNRRIQWTSALVGTAVATVLFEIGKYIIALSLSLSMIIDFYGSMGSLVMLMFWVYYTIQILLVGAECAIEFETKGSEVLVLKKL